MADTKINGRQFRVGEVLATEAIRLQTRLLKIIGGGVDRLPTIMRGMGEKGRADAELRAESDAAAVAALTDIFAACDPNEVSELIGDIIRIGTIKRPSGSWEQMDLDGDFTQHKGDILPVVFFILKEVLGDFFSGTLASGNLKGMMAG